VACGISLAMTTREGAAQPCDEKMPAPLLRLSG